MILTSLVVLAALAGLHSHPAPGNSRSRDENRVCQDVRGVLEALRVVAPSSSSVSRCFVLNWYPHPRSVYNLDQEHPLGMYECMKDFIRVLELKCPIMKSGEYADLHACITSEWNEETFYDVSTSIIFIRNIYIAFEVWNYHSQSDSYFIIFFSGFRKTRVYVQRN